MWENEDDYNWMTYKEFFSQNKDHYREWARLLGILIILPLFVLGKEFSRFLDWAVYKNDR